MGRPLSSSPSTTPQRPKATPPRHDALIETAGNSAHLAVAPNGDIYYGTFSNNTLYRWTAAQVAGVTNDLYADDPEEDTFLTLADAVESWAMPGAGNGLAVDEAGHVFFSVNDWATNDRILAMVDPSQPSGYQEIFTVPQDDYWYYYFGPISVDGDLLNGGTLYFSSAWGATSLAAIHQVPEPGCFALIVSALTLILIVRRQQRSQ